MATTSTPQNISALSRLIYKLHPPPPPRYGPRGINQTKEVILSRFLKRFAPPPLRTDVQWYVTSINRKLDRDLDFWTEATGQYGKELTGLLHEIRDRAWRDSCYPCFGLWLFLLPGLSDLPIYSDVVLHRARAGDIIFDFGCGLGQEIRRITSAVGIPSTQVYALDVSPELWNLGLELFNDTSEPPAKFIHADARTHDSSSFLTHPSLLPLTGKIDVILLSHFLDLFHWSDQMQVGVTIAFLSRVGSQAMGCMRGTRGKTLDCESMGGWYSQSMVHDVLSLKMLWYDIGKFTETQWNVEASMVEPREWGWEDEEVKWMSVEPPMGIWFIASRES